MYGREKNSVFNDLLFLLRGIHVIGRGKFSRSFVNTGPDLIKSLFPPQVHRCFIQVQQAVSIWGLTDLKEKNKSNQKNKNKTKTAFNVFYSIFSLSFSKADFMWPHPQCAHRQATVMKPKPHILCIL